MFMLHTCTSQNIVIAYNTKNTGNLLYTNTILKLQTTATS